MALGLGIGITKRTGGVAFPNNISDPIERAIVQALGITKAEYNANGISNYVDAWWNAQSLTTGDPVTSIGDKSGNSNTLTPTGGTITISPNALNGNDIFDLSGTDQPLESTVTMVGDYTAIVVFEPKNGSYMPIAKDGTPVGYICMSSTSSRTSASFALISGPTFFANGEDVTNPQRGPLGDSFAVYDYAILTATGNYDWGNGIAIAGFSSSTFGLTTSFAEALIIPSQLTTQQRESIESAIADKYGITLA